MEEIGRSQKGRHCIEGCPQGSWEKCATAADKRVATHETEVASAKTLHSRLIGFAIRSVEDANNARTGIHDLQARLIKVERAKKLTLKDLYKVRQPSAKSA